MEFTIQQLEILLNDQKRIVIERLLNGTGYYNTESTAGVYKTLPIDKEKFTEQGLKASYPDEFNVLKKYVK